MMMRRALPALLLGLAATGCVEFVEPDGLGLMRPVRVEAYITAAGAAGCGDALDGGRATVCLDVRFSPGIDRYGRTRAVLIDTLWAMGTPLLPETRSDTLLLYRAGWRVPVPQLADTAFDVRFPVVDGVPLAPPAIRWYGFGRQGPDTLTVAPSGIVTIDVLSPGVVPQPQPRLHQWLFDFFGPNAVFTMRGTGFPWSTYRLPDALLDQLETQVVPARLLLNQIYFVEPRRDDLTMFIQFTQHLEWQLRRAP